MNLLNIFTNGSESWVLVLLLLLGIGLTTNRAIKLAKAEKQSGFKWYTDGFLLIGVGCVLAVIIALIWHNSQY